MQMLELKANAIQIIIIFIICLITLGTSFFGTRVLTSETDPGIATSIDIIYVCSATIAITQDANNNILQIVGSSTGQHVGNTFEPFTIQCNGREILVDSDRVYVTKNNLVEFIIKVGESYTSRTKANILGLDSPKTAY